MKAIRIIEMRSVVNELTVTLTDARFGHCGPIKGTFLLLGLPGKEVKVTSPGFKTLSVRCHWESSDDPDDYLDFIAVDDGVNINRRYSGPVIWRIGTP